MDILVQKIRERYQSIPIDNRDKYLTKCSAAELEIMFSHPEIFLFDKQIPPNTPWRYHWYRGGRGIGKTFASTSWLYGKIIRGANEVAIVGPDYSTLHKEILPQFEKHFTPKQREKLIFNGKDNMYRYGSDCIIKVYSSEVEIRGLNAECGIAEEVCKWCDQVPEKIRERFDLFDMGVRSRKADPNPQIFIASTPKTFSIFTDFVKQIEAGNTDYSMIIMETSENPYLDDSTKRTLYQKFGSTRQGRQELYGDILTDNPDALWSSSMLDKCHISSQEFNSLIERGILSVVKSVVAVDAAVSTNANSDETGIIVSTLCDDNKVYILEDASGKHSPNEWATTAVELYHKYNASHIILESNQGGNLLEQNIKSVDRYVRTHLIHASVSKQTRFEPVVAAYERKEIYHVGDLSTLENQMLSFNPYAKSSSSPDRADAMAYTVYYLLLGQPTPVQRSTKNFGSW